MIETLAAAGIPVSVMIAPVIPGLNDSQMVTVLERAAAAGATSAGWTLLRLPGSVKEVFEGRVRAAMPLAADKILHRIRDTRGGDKLYDARFGTRGRGEGPYAETLATMFEATCIEGLRHNLANRGQHAILSFECVTGLCAVRGLEGSFEVTAGYLGDIGTQF